MVAVRAGRGYGYRPLVGQLTFRAEEWDELVELGHTTDAETDALVDFADHPELLDGLDSDHRRVIERALTLLVRVEFLTDRVAERIEEALS